MLNRNILSFVASAVGFLNLAIHSQEFAVSPSTDPNVQSFNLVWQTIRESHWDSSKVGKNWEVAYSRLLPQVQAARSTTAVRKVMNELLETLEQSHFGIIPSANYQLQTLGVGGGQGNVGITARLVEDSAIVTHVRANSSAAKNQVRPGWQIVRIRNRDLAKILSKLAQRKSQGLERVETTVGLLLSRMLSDKVGKAIALKFQDGDGSSREMKLNCEVPPNAEMAQFGHLPAIQVTHETKSLENNIGYYRFNAFLNPRRVMSSFRAAVRNENHSRGLVIDLRGNIGGIALMTMGMASEFVNEKQDLGVMTLKDSKLKLFAYPRANPISVPLAILVDECSISSAEILAGGLQDLGIAKVFGARTAGLALPSQIIKLPNDDGFQYAMADYHSASGKSLERDGVIPDYEIQITRQKLRDEGDPILNAAIEWISEAIGGPAR